MLSGKAVAFAAAILGSSQFAGAQVTDSTPPVRHILAIDYARIKPFHRVYDIVVITPDSTTYIGKRDVALVETMLPDSTPAWTLIEMRSGSIASVDSLTLAADLRPVRWSSRLGAASLNFTFTLDSMAGRIRMGAAGRTLSSAIPPDLITSEATLELLASLLPLGTGWSDSTSVLEMDLSHVGLKAAELAVTGEDSVIVTPGMPARQSWVLTLRAGVSESRLWVDRETLEVLRSQQVLPSPAGASLEYRIKPPQLSTAP
jgi:hypothetical protein